MCYFKIESVCLFLCGLEFELYCGCYLGIIMSFVVLELWFGEVIFMIDVCWVLRTGFGNT